MSHSSSAAEPSGDTQSGTKKKHTTRNVLLGFLAAFVVVALFAGVFLFNLARSFDSKSEKLDAFPESSTRPTKAQGDAGDARNILLLGSDSRGDASDTAIEGEASDQRSDTIMWIHIPSDHKHVYTMSILRDTWVDIPGHGEAKINAAMAYGGVPLTVQTLEGLLDTRIDHVAMVNFDGFKAITDALDGVTVNVPVPFSTSKFDFPKGAQNLDGEKALQFVRERYAFDDGDYQRVKDQQIFLKALVSKLLSRGTLTNPGKVNNVVNDFSPYVSTDKDFGSKALASLALDLRGLEPANLVSFTMPDNGGDVSADGQSIIVPDMDAIEQIGAALREDRLERYLSKADVGQ